MKWYQYILKFLGLYKPVKEAKREYPIFTIGYLLTLASKNGFILTEESIIDGTDKKEYPLNKEAAERTTEVGYLNKDSEFYKEHREQIILNRAIRFTLYDIPRFREIVNNHKADFCLKL